MRRQSIARLAVAAAVLAAIPALADHGDRKSFRVFLHGYEEVPAVNTPAEGRLELRIANDEASVAYTLSYQNLRGNVTQAHIHFGQRGVNGGIMVWLCGTTALPGPAGTPACPTPGGSVSGTFASAPVVGPAAQLLAPTDLASVIDAIRSGVAYANVHSSAVASGEIRGQLR